MLFLRIHRLQDDIRVHCSQHSVLQDIVLISGQPWIATPSNKFQHVTTLDLYLTIFYW